MKDVDKSNLGREKLAKAAQSPFKTYIDFTVGQAPFLQFLLYEILIIFIGPMPGGIGLYLRKKLYPILFKKVGQGLIIGRNVVIRHPDKIEIGNNVTIDDNCVIDARGAGINGIILEDNVIINRNCLLLAKAGPIRLGKSSSIGSNSVIVSIDGVELGEAVLVAGGCALSAGSYQFNDLEKAIMDQGVYSKGPIRIGTKAWLGTGAIILDGVSIGSGAVVGAGAVLLKDIDDNAIAVGNPAKILRYRNST
jgi:acetyltransferase-like isoleucine patch superfamily enzyme